MKAFEPVPPLSLTTPFTPETDEQRECRALWAAKIKACIIPGEGGGIKKDTCAHVRIVDKYKVVNHKKNNIMRVDLRKVKIIMYHKNGWS